MFKRTIITVYLLYNIRTILIVFKYLYFSLCHIQYDTSSTLIAIHLLLPLTLSFSFSLFYQPFDRLSYGAVKWFIISDKEGLLLSIDEASLKEILAMESYRSHQFFIEAGDSIKKTQNCFSWGGAVIFANTDSAILERDYARCVLYLSILILNYDNIISQILNIYCVVFRTEFSYI